MLLVLLAAFTMLVQRGDSSCTLEQQKSAQVCQNDFAEILAEAQKMSSGKAMQNKLCCGLYEYEKCVTVAAECGDESAEFAKQTIDYMKSEQSVAALCSGYKCDGANNTVPANTGDSSCILEQHKTSQVCENDFAEMLAETEKMSSEKAVRNKLCCGLYEFEKCVTVAAECGDENAEFVKQSIDSKKSEQSVVDMCSGYKCDGANNSIPGNTGDSSCTLNHYIAFKLCHSDYMETLAEIEKILSAKARKNKICCAIYEFGKCITVFRKKCGDDYAQRVEQLFDQMKSETSLDALCSAYKCDGANNSVPENTGDTTCILEKHKAHQVCQNDFVKIVAEARKKYIGKARKNKVCCALNEFEKCVTVTAKMCGDESPESVKQAIDRMNSATYANILCSGYKCDGANNTVAFVPANTVANTVLANRAAMYFLLFLVCFVYVNKF